MATLFAPPVGATGATPTLRVFVSESRITVERNRRGFVFADPGAWVTPVGDDFELWVSRPDYDTPITIKQVDPDTKAVLRTFPAPAKDAWAGLKDFAHYGVRDADGKVVAGDTFSFCPNGHPRQRLSDESPLNPTYPSFCNGGPFTRARSGASTTDGRPGSSAASTAVWAGRPSAATTGSRFGSTPPGWTCSASAPTTPRPWCT